MSEATIFQPFGRRAVTLRSPDPLLALEKEERRTGFFAQVDYLAAFAIGRTLKGEIAITVERALHEATVVINGLESDQKQFLANVFSVGELQSRGAWFLPERATLRTGLADLPAIFSRYPRFAHHICDQQSAKVIFAENPAAVFVWAYLEPFFHYLFLPLEMRASWSGLKSREEHLSAWAEFDKLIAALGLALKDELAVMRYGGGWGRLSRDGQIKVKQNFLASIADQTTDLIPKRFRAFCCLDLITHYYSMAQDGKATRKQALNRPSDKKALVAFFQGDWLRLLEYLGEQPHPDEQVVTAIPQTKFFVGGAKDSAAVALKTGVSLEEVERIASTFWNPSGGKTRPLASPVEERVASLSDFWAAFDDIHSRQAPAMKSLWGLIEESRSIRLSWEGPDWYNPRLYYELLPKQLTVTVEELWGAILLSERPDRIVSEISPHALMAETFGPALAFWHECALTAWFVCEGPYSRTTIQDMPGYFHRPLRALELLGTPIDLRLFIELSKAEARLGPPSEVPFPAPKHSKFLGSILKFLGSILEPDISVTMSWSRRSGFENLRDIITRYRREWARQHLTAYLRARWEKDIREPARFHAQTMADKGKTPAAKHFARQATVATNRWFGGDISAFCASIGEKSAFRPIRVSLMPADRRGFATKVLAALQANRSNLVEHEARGQSAAQQKSDLEHLAEESLRVVQLMEALGRSPTLEEFGRSDYWAQTMGTDVNHAWETYIRLIEATLDAPAM
jgi:hypothetical protein